MADERAQMNRFISKILSQKGQLEYATHVMAERIAELEAENAKLKPKPESVEAP